MPGVLIALCLMIYSYIYCKIHGEDKDKLNAKCMELRAKGLGTVLKEGFWALMSPVIIWVSVVDTSPEPISKNMELEPE